MLANLRMAVAKMCFTDGGQAGTRGNGLSLVYPSWSSPTTTLLWNKTRPILAWRWKKWPWVKKDSTSKSMDDKGKRPKAAEK